MMHDAYVLKGHQKMVTSMTVNHACKNADKYVINAIRYESSTVGLQTVPMWNNTIPTLRHVEYRQHFGDWDQSGR
jgi:hypothetical protein